MRGMWATWLAVLAICLGVPAAAARADGPYPVGMRQMEYIAPADGRHLAFALFYPAAPAADARPRGLTFFARLSLFVDAPVVADRVKRPLVMFSHGASSNPIFYAWFGQYLAARGYMVAMLYHYRANTYDLSVMYLRSKLWQRPRDISLDITGLLKDPVWGPHIDAGKIGVAGHSQGGFTSLWIGGATVDPALFAAYQAAWKKRIEVPAYLRAEMPVDAAPARDVHDARVKAVFSMAPGDLPGFGMDAAGLRKLALPTYIIVGARDTQAPPKENAEFAAANVPHAKLDVLPGLVDHEIFVNECDQLGRDSWPEACIDDPSVDRAAWHAHIGEAALKFFDANLGVVRGP